MKMEITFTEAEIVQILKNHLKKQGYITQQHTVKETKQYYGQRDEYSKNIFGGITFSVRAKDKKNQLDNSNPYETYGMNDR